jgi:hypothetical protein
MGWVSGTTTPWHRHGSFTSLAAQAWVSASTWSEGSLRLLQPSQTCSSGFAGSPATGYYAGMDWQQQREEGCQRGSSPSESSGQRDSMPRHSLYDRGTRYRPLRASGSAWGDAERVAGWAEPGVVSAGCSSTAVASTLSSMSASVTVASASASLAPVVPAEGASINTAAGPVSTSLRGGHTRAAPAY